MSGHCVDGACCDVAACDPNDACVVHSCATGTCRSVDWAACNVAACELVAASCPASDSDGDGLSDAWETDGYIDMNCNGKFDDGDVPLASADANVPDIYVLYDWMEFTGSGAACTSRLNCALDEQCVAGQCAGDTHDPEAGAPGALDAVVAQFAARGINLHIVRGHARPHSHITSFTTPTASCAGADVAPGTLGAYAVNFFDVKNAAPYPFPSGYERAFHYALFAHENTCDTDEHCASCPGGTFSQGASGLAELPGNDFIVSLGSIVDETACLDD